jgi:uncharacterized repeat protein (TIGR02059 family)
MTGGQVASITNQPVTNNLAVATGIPVLQSCLIQATAPSTILMNFDLDMAYIDPAQSTFKILVNNVQDLVTNITVAGKSVLLTLASPVSGGSNVILNYTKPADRPLQAKTGGQVASISNLPVVNNVPASGVPVLQSCVIQSTSPITIVMNFNLDMAYIDPAQSTFYVLVNNIQRYVTNITVGGKSVFLTLASPVYAGNTVVLNYTAPSVRPLQAKTGGLVASISNLNVTNNITALKKSAIVIDKYSVYPNPAKEFINVFVPQQKDSKPQKIRIYDLSGRLTMEDEISRSGEQTRIPISLKSGIYVVQILRDKTPVFSQKILVTP